MNIGCPFACLAAGGPSRNPAKGFSMNSCKGFGPFDDDFDPFEDDEETDILLPLE